MESLAYSDEDVAKIRQHFQVDENKIKESVDILKTWIAQQKHLPNNQDDAFLERYLLRNKFRIEQSKIKLESYYTLRGLHREFFSEKNDDFVPSRQPALYLPLPRLTPNQERIVLFVARNYDPDLYDFVTHSRGILLGSEICLRNDYAIGEKLIMDFNGWSLSHIKKISLADLHKCYTFYTKTFSGRILSIAIINAPPYINVLLGLFKLVFSEKLYSRISVHNKGEDLSKLFPKECLPCDYGGDLPTIGELAEKWDKVFEANYEMLNRNYHNVSNESLRIGELGQGHGFGTDGTFKKLNLD